MKTIAGVTLNFLPSIAVATFFSMSFFHVGSEDRDKIRLTVGHEIWLYITAAIPLTLITLVIWFMWMRYKKGNKTSPSDVESLTREAPDGLQWSSLGSEAKKED